MTDAELIARLRDSVNGEYDMTPHGADVLQVTDRIEALIRENSNLRQIERNVQAVREHEFKRAEAAEAKLAECEVRLRKAVELLKLYVDIDDVGGCERAALAEIKGESHE